MTSSAKWNVKRVLLTLVLLEFLGVSTWAMWEVGYLGVWKAGLSDPGSMQILFDLVVACLFGGGWLMRHARARGRNPWPWLAAMLPLGSIPLLVYAVGSMWLETEAEHEPALA